METLDPEKVYNVRIAFQTSQLIAVLLYRLMSQKVLTHEVIEETCKGFDLKARPRSKILEVRKALAGHNVSPVTTSGVGYSLLPEDRDKLKNYVAEFQKEAA
ncbi:hypothetical protein [Methylocystis heyeri]|uniref:Uncharacterized protein n=1 Tax=Methylocystis heyeri TaxID=391905 RepID=A0A6B8KGP4_9HYPH|nr:hypothetical protein [Methylocystis heyeri]QGM46145.1 hypothetical protein H2LOC_010805 [Methylocystis heyeri]